MAETVTCSSLFCHPQLPWRQKEVDYSYEDEANRVHLVILLGVANTSQCHVLNFSFNKQWSFFKSQCKTMYIHVLASHLTRGTLDQSNTSPIPICWNLFHPLIIHFNSQFIFQLHLGSLRLETYLTVILTLGTPVVKDSLVGLTSFLLGCTR